MSQPYPPPQNAPPQNPHGQGGWQPPGPQGSYGPQGAPPGPPKKGTSTVLLIILAVVGVGVLSLVVLGVIAWSGMRRYLAQSKMIEGRNTVGALARGVVLCVETDMGGLLGGSSTTPGLPPTSPKVPASLAQVRGTKYQSLPSDWSAPAFKCASFSMSSPQYFQYQWVLTTPGSKGTVRAEADLDGDGVAEVVYEEDVECSGSPGNQICTLGTLREKS